MTFGQFSYNFMNFDKRCSKEVRNIKQTCLLSLHLCLWGLYLRVASIQKVLFTTNFCGFYSSAASDREWLLMARVHYLLFRSCPNYVQVISWSRPGYILVIFRSIPGHIHDFKISIFWITLFHRKNLGRGSTGGGSKSEETFDELIVLLLLGFTKHGISE